MVDPDLILENSLARQGLAFLLESGVLAEQQVRLMDRLTSGGTDEKDEELLIRVKEYRIQSRFVTALQELGEQIKSEEKNNEPR